MVSLPDLIYHITSQADWKAALKIGTYRADSLDSQGFIHASTGAEVIHTANRYYRGQHGLVLLCIDACKVTAEVRFENLEGGQELFPHIYGPLDLEAVIEVQPFEPGPDGTFISR